MDFDYFYNREAERFNFLKVPEILVDGEEFKGLSAEAIILYSMFLKRTGMSFKNNWIDKEGRVFIYFTVEEIMRRRNISKPTAIKTLDELDSKKGIGLIERVRLGLGKPNVIYVKELRKSHLTKFKLIEEIDSLDVDDKHYKRRKSDLDDRLYRMYDKIEELEGRLIEAKTKKETIETEKLTGDNIYKVLIYFDKLYKVMNDVERRQLIEALISEIQIYEEKQANGQWLKSIIFKLPIIDEELSISLDNDEQG